MEILLAILGSGALSALISGCFTLASVKRRRSSGVTAGTRMLLYDRIKYLGRKHLAKGEIASEDLEDLIAMHRVYHDELGGNGYLDTLMQNVKNLQIKKEAKQ